MTNAEASTKLTAAAVPVAPIPRTRDLRPLGLIALAIGMVASVLIATRSFERIKTRPVERSIEITGSAKQSIRADLAEWSAGLSTENLDRTVAYRDLKAHLEIARAFLLAQGFTEAELSTSAASFNERSTRETTGTYPNQVEKTIFLGYHTDAAITVKSKDVDKVERVAREVTQLLEQGITITSGDPSYYYTKLGELKIQMLAEASSDARVRAEKMLGSAGGATIGRLLSANMGVININPTNSTATSWEGNNDTSSIDKDIITTVRASYALR